MNPEDYNRMYAMSRLGSLKNERQAWRALHDTKLREQKQKLKALEVRHMDPLRRQRTTHNVAIVIIFLLVMAELLRLWISWQ